MPEIPEHAIDRIKAGGRLSIVLQPDHSVLETTEPEYREALALPFVFVDGEDFSGMTRPCHMIEDETGALETVGFSYTTGLPFYTILYTQKVKKRDAQIGAKLMSVNQYRMSRFVVHDGAKKLLTLPQGSIPEGDLAAFRESIQRGRSHFCVIEFSSEKVWSLPIDISYDFWESDAVEFRTEATPLSRHIAETAHFQATVKQARPEIGALMQNPLFAYEDWFPLQNTYFRLFGSGEYAPTPLVKDTALRRFDRLTIFENP